MNNQFYYTRKETRQPQPGSVSSTLEEVSYRDSFNINKVIRTLTLESGQTVVLLDDIHDRTMETPVMSKNGTIMNYRTKKSTFQTEIYLDKEDADRFFELTNLSEKASWEL